MSVADVANYVTIVGLPLGVAGLWSVFRQIKLDRLSVSASAVATLHENVRIRVETLSEIEPLVGEDANPKWTAAFRDLLNDLEVACAAYLDSQFSGRSGELAQFLIGDMLVMCESDPSLRSELATAIHDPDTFKNIRDFIAQQKKKTRRV